MIALKTEHIIIIGIVAALGIAYAGHQTKQYLDESLPDVVDAIDPTKETNLANRFFHYIYKAVTGSEQQLGEDIYDFLH